MSISPSDPPVLHFLYRNLINRDGGVFTNYRTDLPVQPDKAVNHDILSESTGLMLQYALTANKEGIYRQQTQFLRSYLLQPNGHIVWKTDGSIRQAKGSDATVDDLRIIGALLDGSDKWGPVSDRHLASKIANALLRDNRANDLLADHYNPLDQTRSDTVTSSYLDIAVMTKLANENAGWRPVEAASLHLLEEAALPSGLYRKTYSLSKRAWDAPEGGVYNMIDTLLAAEHAEEAAAATLPTLRLVEELWKRDGRIYASYRDNLQTASSNESPAVYALAIKLLERAGDTAEALPLRKRMAELSIQDPASPFYGGYLDPITLECYSFDNLQALQALQVEKK